MHARRLIRRCGALAAALAALTLLGACSDDDGGSDASTTTETGATTSAVDDSTGDTSPTREGTSTTAAPATTIAEDDLDPEAVAIVDALAPEEASEVERCTATQFVDLLGADRIAASGFDPSDPASVTTDDLLADAALSEDEATDLYDRMTACGTDFVDQFVAGIAGEQEADPEAEACVRERVDVDAIRTMVIASMQGAESDPDAIDSDALAACFAD